jgi:hypothetical protein
MSARPGNGWHARQVDQWERSGRNPEYAPESRDDDSAAPMAPPYEPPVYRSTVVVPDTAADIDDADELLPVGGAQ